MNKKKPGSSSNELHQSLTKMSENGNFPISVLTDQNGLPIAFVARTGFDPDRQAAVVALVQKTASQVGKQLGMAQADEISVFDTNGQRLVCRPFTAGEYDLVLAVLVPDKEQPYRRLTTQAITEIKRIWSQYWG